MLIFIQVRYNGSDFLCVSWFTPWRWEKWSYTIYNVCVGVHIFWYCGHSLFIAGINHLYTICGWCCCCCCPPCRNFFYSSRLKRQRYMSSLSLIYSFASLDNHSQLSLTLVVAETNLSILRRAHFLSSYIHMSNSKCNASLSIASTDTATIPFHWMPCICKKNIFHILCAYNLCRFLFHQFENKLNDREWENWIIKHCFDKQRMNSKLLY